MVKQVTTAITPTRNEDYPEWYQQVIKASDLAERSPVRGCMVIKPWGYTLWENIVRELADMFKPTGVRNANFPPSMSKALPKSALSLPITDLKKGPMADCFPPDPLPNPLLCGRLPKPLSGNRFQNGLAAIVIYPS